jgi:hypothetical protein
MTIEMLVSLIIYIIVIGAVCGLLWWLIGYIGIPEPFAKIARGIIAVVAVIFLISLLLSLVGHPLGIVPLRLR